MRIILHYYPDIIIAKGQNHFICKNRSDEYFIRKNEGEYQKLRNEIDNICERSDLTITISDKVWNEINVKEFNPVFCRQNCVHKDYCFYYNLRHELLSTDGIILCNQDLLTINLKKRYGYSKELLTDRFQYVVIDEVHNLEGKVRNSYTIEINYNFLRKTIEQHGKEERTLWSISLL